jgi:hypothetical protein
MRVWLAKPDDGGCNICIANYDIWTYLFGQFQIRLCEQCRKDMRQAKPNTCNLCYGAKRLWQATNFPDGEYAPCPCQNKETK